MVREAVAVKGSGVTQTRELLRKAAAGRLSADDTARLRGEMAGLAEKVARLNARFGRQVASLSEAALSAASA